MPATKNSTAFRLLPALAMTSQSILFPAAASMAQAADYNPGEVVVTARQYPVEAVATVETVTAAEIQRRGVRTLDEAVALLPGVDVRVGGDGTPRIQVRGLETRHIKLLLDGVPLNSTYDGNFDPTTIPAEIIDRIKLTKGSSSMLYGDGTLGGAINIITKRGSGALHVSGAGAEAGTGGYRRGWGSASGATGTMDYFVSASRLDRASFPLSRSFARTSLEDGGSRNNSDLARTNLLGSLGFDITRALRLGLVISHFDGKQGLPPSTRDSTTDIFANRARFERLENQVSDTQQFTVDYVPSGSWWARGWVYHSTYVENDNSYDNANYNSISNTALNGTFLQQSQTAVGGGHGQVSYQAGTSGVITAAADLRREYWDDSGVIRDVAVAGGGGGGGKGGGKGGGGGATTYALRTLNDQRDVEVRSLALEYSVSPMRQLDLTAGAGRYWQKRSLGPSDSANAFLLGVAYQLADATGLRAAFSKHIRFPTIRQLYDPSSGDASLKSESARNAEVGLKHKLSATAQMGATVFRNDVRNYIEKDDALNRFRNFDHYRFQGVELTGETRMSAGLRLRATYTYLDALNLSPGTRFEELQYRPRHKAALEAWYEFGGGWNVYGSVGYVGTEVFYSRTTPLRQAQLDSHSLVNVKIAKRLGSSGASAFVGANNLFDRNYETSYGFPQAGRFVFAGIEYGL